MVTIGHILIS